MSQEVLSAEDRTTKNPMLEARSINGGYGKVKILYGIDLSVKKNEIVTIIGPNGCGKSTFLKVIYGLTTFYSGGVTYNGADVTGERTDILVRKGISYVPQVNNIFPELTINENLKMGGYLTKGSLQDDLERVYNVFPDLVPRKFDLAGNLSGGQRQMLAIGRSLMTNPKFLLLDEPTAALSPLYVEQILTKIKELRDNEDMTVLLVEQNAKSALKHSDYGYIFSSGKMVHHNLAEKILNDPNIGELFLGKVHD